MLPFLLLALLGFLQCLILASLIVPFVRNNAERLGLMDRPGIPRKLHDRPIPRAGGIAIFAAFWGCVLADLAIAALLVPKLDFLPENIRNLGGNVGLKWREVAGLFVGSTTIFVLGVADDRWDLPPEIRLLVQFIACLPLVFSGVVLKLFLPFPLAAVATALWLVFLTNSFNFLDNMNGLTSGVSVIICGAMGLISALSHEWYSLVLYAMLGGAVLGFWFYNFPKASVFLGDGGSTHLGFLLGAMAILVTYYQEGVPTRLPVLMPLVVLGIPIFDTVSVMWIRWKTGKPFMQGDTNHLSHRLVALGMTRPEAVLFIYGATLVLGLAAVPLRQLDWKHGLVHACAIALIFILLHWLERVGSRRSQESSRESLPPKG